MKRRRMGGTYITGHGCGLGKEDRVHDERWEDGGEQRGARRRRAGDRAEGRAE